MEECGEWPHRNTVFRANLLPTQVEQVGERQEPPGFLLLSFNADPIRNLNV
jgi:hypothetical protein